MPEILLDESQYGGGKTRPTRSALTGRLLSGGHVYPIKLDGTPFAVGLNASEWRALSQEDLDAMKVKWASEVPQDAVEAASAPAYEDMSLEDLKALATERGVDIAGKRSKADIAQALRAADVAARFAPISIDIPAADGGEKGEA